MKKNEFKIVIIGPGGVGKTNMLLRYVDNIFSESHIATIGVEYKTKTITRGKYKVKFEYILCGNKIDLENKREVKFDEAKEYSIKKKIDYIETSAKTGINLSQAFEKIVDLIIKNRSADELVREFGVKSISRGYTLTKQKANANNSGQKQGCCNK